MSETRKLATISIKTEKPDYKWLKTKKKNDQNYMYKFIISNPLTFDTTEKYRFIMYGTYMLNKLTG